MAEVKINEVIGSILREITKGLDKETLKELADLIFDFIEEKTTNKAMMVMIKTGRALLKISDKDYGSDKVK